MSVSAEDLTYPPAGTGELHPDWWPDGALPGLLAVWIAAGAALVPGDATAERADRVTLSYAYWLAYGDKLITMAASPNSVSVDKGDISAAWAKDQRDIFAARLKYWLGEYETAVADVVPMVVIDNPPRASQSVAFQSVF